MALGAAGTPSSTTIERGTHHPDSEQRAWTVFICGNCNAPNFIQFRRSSHFQQYMYGSVESPEAFRSSDFNREFTSEKWLPEREIKQASKYVPNIAARAYNDAEKAYQAGAFGSAGSGFRRTLDLATKRIAAEHLDPGEADQIRNLYDRIERLGNDHILTPGLKEWAHEIREDGNDFLHDDEPGSVEDERHDATEIRSFAELFLIYAFDLPGRMAERRGQTAPPETDAADDAV